MNNLFDIPAGADFMIVFDITAHQTPLIEDILNPLNELVAAAAQFPLLCERRGAGKDEDRDTPFGRVMDGPGERLGPTLDVNEDRLRAQLRVVDTVLAPAAQVSTAAQFEVTAGLPGIRVV